MANVLFKRGLQSNLPASNAASDGVFYLTTDTNRLYVGQGTNLKLLNQTVQIVDNFENLPTTWTGAEAAAHTNDFFYCTIPNVLAVWDGTQWKQINKNTDTTIDGSEFGTAASNGVTTVSYTVTDSAGTATVASFGIEGAGGITASTTGDNVLLTGTTYSISRAVDASNNEASVILTDSHSTTSAVVLKGGENVTITSEGLTGIVVAAQDTTLDGAELTVNSGTVQLVITDSEGASTTATTTGVGVVLHDGSRVLLADASGVTSNGAIYSAAEIDNMFKGLDGMTYRGTIASSGTVATVHTLPTTSVRKGDVYVVSDNDLEVSDLGAGVVTELSDELSKGIRIGDMFIATGTEGADGFIASPQWTFIPSGNDSAAQFTYSAEATTSTNTLTLSNELPSIIASVTLTASTGIVVTSSSVNGNDLNASISHATVTTTATTSTAASNTSFSAISSLTLDNGHVIGINTETFEVPEYSFTDTRSATLIDSSVVNGTRVTTATNAGPNDLSVAHNLLQDDSAIASSVTKFSSSSLILSKGNDGEVVMNIEWGKF